MINVHPDYRGAREIMDEVEKQGLGLKLIDWPNFVFAWPPDPDPVVEAAKNEVARTLAPAVQARWQAVTWFLYARDLYVTNMN